MSRRHHHNLQPYDYEHERFIQHPRDRDRDQPGGIEYQDDSLSSINSDEESYLHHAHAKMKKSGFYSSKNAPGSKSRNEKNSESYHQKEPKSQAHTASNSDSTSERLGRLEAMLEQLVKQNAVTPTEQPPPPIVHEKKLPSQEPKEHHGRFVLEPRKHSFTTSMWINKIQEFSIQNNWDEKTTISYMSTQMSGIVKAWYNCLPSYDFTWPEWKILITKMFPDNVDFVTTLKRLVTRLKQADETIPTYYFSKMYLIEACKITGEDAVSCLIDGLNNQAVQEQAKAQNFLTPETLYSQFLTVLPEYTVDYAPADTVMNSWHFEPPNVQEDHGEEDIGEEHVFVYDKDERTQQFNYQEMPNTSFEELPKHPAPVHSRLDKRYIRRNEFKQQSKVPMAAKVCSICFSRGHLARNCRKGDKMLFSCLSGCVPSKCFYKNCLVNGRKFDAFVDTGCTTVLITEEKARSLDLPIQFTGDRIQTYGGGYVEVLGKTQVLLKVDSVETLVEAVVVPNNAQDVSVIIGQGFLNQKNVCVFLHNNTLKIFEASDRLTD